MTDRVYPSTKPKPTTKSTTKSTTTTPNGRLPAPPSATTPNGRLPAPPSATTRHPYRPNPIPTLHTRRTRRRRCFCICFFWSLLILTLLLLISAVAGCIFYLLYHPHLPTFSIASVKLSEFNLTTTTADTTRLTTKLNLTISTTNPNKKQITFYYNKIHITCISRDTLISQTSYQTPLQSNPFNTTIIHSSLNSNTVILDPQTVNSLRSDLKRKSGLPLKILIDTQAQVKVETLKSKKVGIRIQCEGIHSMVPKHGGRNASVAAKVSGAKCKVDLRIKIWKWTF